MTDFRIFSLILCCALAGCVGAKEVAPATNADGTLDLAVTWPAIRSGYQTQLVPDSTDLISVTVTGWSSHYRKQVDLRPGFFATSSIHLPVGLARVEASAYSSGIMTASGSTTVVINAHAHTPSELILNPFCIPVLSSWYAVNPVAPGDVVTVDGWGFRGPLSSTPSISVAGIPARVTWVDQNHLSFEMPDAPRPWKLAVSVDGVPMIRPFTLSQVDGVDLSTTSISLNALPELESGMPSNMYVTSCMLAAMVRMTNGMNHGVVWTSSSPMIRITPNPGASIPVVMIQTVPGAPEGSCEIYAAAADDPAIRATCSVRITTFGDAAVSVD